MYDPKEVIQGLTQCTQPNEGVWCICTNPVVCPYLNTERCEWHLMDDALSMIRDQQARIKELEEAQEPRVMTLEEARKRDISYVELRTEDYILPCIVGSLGDGDVIHVKPLSEGFRRILPHREYYGKNWRCWTARPTDEQREETPWPS